jgi:hypothetical protein
MSSGRNPFACLFHMRGNLHVEVSTDRLMGQFVATRLSRYVGWATHRSHHASLCGAHFTLSRTACILHDVTCMYCMINESNQ